MKPKKSLGILFLAVVIAGLVVFLLVRQDKEEMDVSEVEVKTPSNQPQESIPASPQDVRLKTKTKEHKRIEPRLSTRAIDKQKRAEILALILSALQEKERQEQERHSREARKPGGLPPEYVREAVKEIVPLLKECYDMELEVRGNIRGKVVLGFDLVADDEHGGLVEEASILESELSKEISDSFAECLRETVYALRLDAPEWGGRHTVRYPLYFSAIGYDD